MKEATAGQVRGLTLDPDNPWPGLHAFEEGARDYFHGRETEAAGLLSQVVESPVTVLFGKSGLGKSSLLKAGLFPRLRELGFLPVYVRLDFRREAPAPTDQVGRALREELEREGVDAPPMREGETLWEYLHRAGLEFWSARNRLLTPVLVLDQFEEVYTLGPRLGRALDRFRIDLGDLAENRIPAVLAEQLERDEAAASGLDLRSMPYKLIVSLREDFLPDLETDRRVIPVLGRVRVRLLAMRPEQALEAVHGAAPHLLDERTARRIVRFVAAEQQDSLRPGDSLVPFTLEEADTEVEPALLSLFCRGLNEERKRQGKKSFDRELLENAKQGIVAGYYRSCLEGLPDRVGRFIEMELITEKGFRNSFAREDAVPTHLRDDELDRLIKARLIRLEERHGTQRLELTHDLLTKAIRVHRDARRAEEKLLEHEQRERELEAEARVGRRFRALSGLLAVALVAALVMTGLALHRGRLADSQQLAYESLDLLQRADAEKSLGLAIEAMDAAETEKARDTLTRALKASVVRKRWEVPLPQASALVVSPDGRRVAAATGGAVGIWDVATGALQSSACGGEMAALDWAPGGESLVLGLGAGAVDLWDPTPEPGGMAVTRLIEEPDGLQRLGVRPDGRGMAVVTGLGALRSFDVLLGGTDGPPRVRPTGRSSAEARPTYESVWSLDYSRDGRQLAIGDSSGRLTLLDVASGRPTVCLPDGEAEINRVRFSDPDLGLVAVSDFAFNVGVRPVDDCASSVTPFPGHRDMVWDLLFTPGGDYLVTVSQDGTMGLWDPATGDKLHSREVPGHSLSRIAAVGDCPPAPGRGGERTCVVTAGSDPDDANRGVLTLWDIAPRAQRDELAAMTPSDDDATDSERLRLARDLARKPQLPEGQALPACPAPGAS